METGNVERSLAKIFGEKVKVFGNVQFTQVYTDILWQFMVVLRRCCCQDLVS